MKSGMSSGPKSRRRPSLRTNPASAGEAPASRCRLATDRNHQPGISLHGRRLAWSQRHRLTQLHGARTLTAAAYSAAWPLPVNRDIDRRTDRRLVAQVEADVQRIALLRAIIAISGAHGFRRFTAALLITRARIARHSKRVVEELPVGGYHSDAHRHCRDRQDCRRDDIHLLP